MPKRPQWSQLFGWAIFALVVAGGPILNAIQNMTGIPIPGYTLPVLIALLMLCNVGFSIWRNMQARRPSDGFPLESGNTTSTNAPMPPFGQSGTGLPRFGTPPARVPPTSMTPPVASPRFPDTTNPALDRARGARGPAFEPVVSPVVILLAVVGIVVLLAGAAVFFIAP